MPAAVPFGCKPDMQGSCSLWTCLCRAGAYSYSGPCNAQDYSPAGIVLPDETVHCGEKPWHSEMYERQALSMCLYAGRSFSAAADIPAGPRILRQWQGLVRGSSHTRPGHPLGALHMQQPSGGLSNTFRHAQLHDYELEGCDWIAEHAGLSAAHVAVSVQRPQSLREPACAASTLRKHHARCYL